MLFVVEASSQNGDHEYGGRFSKLIEFNRLYLGEGYNLNSKEDIEKSFYGEYNAMVEFFHIPPDEARPSEGSFKGPFGFRIIMDSAKSSYALEIKYVTNYEEAISTADKTYPPSIIPVSLIGQMSGQRSLTEDEQELLDRKREEMKVKNRKETNRLINIEGLSLLVSNRFAEKLHQKTVSLIDNFKARGLPSDFPHHARNVTFRAVVGDELWSLKIRMPKGNALTLDDIYRLIVEDVKAHKFDEEKYIKLLDDLQLS
jgi:hypothetical protein